MADSPPRYSTPINAPRPRGKRLLTVFSPKLDRTVRTFDYVGLEQWVRLETDPAVSTFCEHPARFDADDNSRLIDFWVQRGDSEEMLVIQRAGDSDVIPETVAVKCSNSATCCAGSAPRDSEAAHRL